MEKKEVQIKILKERQNGKASKDEFLGILRQVSPGTNVRAGMEGIVKAQKGALIVVESDQLQEILDGGFKINSRFTPQRLVELAKMDGAIILSRDMKRIIHANVTLAPDTKIPTKETGTRHKAAERTARMLGTLAIAVSERKNEINLYYKDVKYHIRETAEVLRRATETLHLLEKQRELFDDHLTLLNVMELASDLHLEQACKVIQKGKAMQKLLDSQERTMIELGKEGEALKLRVKELMNGVEKEADLVIKDYTKLNLKKSKNMIESLSYEELIDGDNILTALAQKEAKKIENIKGWRILSKTSLTEKEIGELTKELKDLRSILAGDNTSFKPLLQEERTQVLLNDIERIKNR